MITIISIVFTIALNVVVYYLTKVQYRQTDLERINNGSLKVTIVLRVTETRWVFGIFSALFMIVAILTSIMYFLLFSVFFIILIVEKSDMYYTIDEERFTLVKRGRIKWSYTWNQIECVRVLWVVTWSSRIIVDTHLDIVTRDGKKHLVYNQDLVEEIDAHVHNKVNSCEYLLKSIVVSILKLIAFFFLGMFFIEYSISGDLNQSVTYFVSLIKMIFI